VYGLDRSNSFVWPVLLLLMLGVLRFSSANRQLRNFANQPYSL
jgi:hypothetical protein